MRIDYDAQSLRDWLKGHRVIATIPSTTTRTVPFKHSRIAYRRLNRIERLFGHLKNWRRVPTRYDRLAFNYLAAVAFASCVIAWTCMSPLPRTWRPPSDEFFSSMYNLYQICYILIYFYILSALLKRSAFNSLTMIIVFS